MPKKRKIKQAHVMPLSEMSFFALSVISVMPRDVYREIKDRLTVALMCLEDGDPNTAKNILEKFLNK
jgi:hypothetical protein